MSTTPAHKLVTSERGRTADGRQGYAARCVAEGCGAITFGGFPSRTAARQALAGHESERPMSDLASRIESAPTDA